MLPIHAESALWESHSWKSLLRLTTKPLSAFLCADLCTAMVHLGLQDIARGLLFFPEEKVVKILGRMRIHTDDSIQLEILSHPVHCTMHAVAQGFGSKRDCSYEPKY